MDRRQGNRRATGRRQEDNRDMLRQRMHLDLADPVRMALWELETERAARERHGRVATMRELAANSFGFKYQPD